MRMGRVLATSGLLIGAAALVLQFAITIPAYMSGGTSLPVALIRFFSFYTILSNSCLVLVYLATLTDWRWLAWFRTSITRTMMVGVIALVMGFYHLILAETWAPEGLFKVADTALHYVTPLLYLLWWELAGRRDQLPWRAIPIMLLPSLIYLAYVMVRGALTADYPYPILDAAKLGYSPVAINIFAVATALTFLFAVAIVADRFLPRRKHS